MSAQPATLRTATGRPTPARRPQSSTLVSQVVGLLEEHCADPGLRPGDSLPAEGQLAETFGVSRVVVREAMKVVEARGIIIRKQGKRAVLAEPNARPIEQFASRSALMDKSNILELSEVRKALEVHAARLAARRVRTDSDAAAGALERCTDLLDQARRAASGASVRAELDVAFHHAVADLSGNVILGQMLAALDKPLHESRVENHRASLRSGAPRQQWVDEHDAVLDAILTGDENIAVRAMEAHLDLSIREVASRPDADIQEAPDD